jgi:alpha-galactosidase
MDEGKRLPKTARPGSHWSATRRGQEAHFTQRELSMEAGFQTTFERARVRPSRLLAWAVVLLLWATASLSIIHAQKTMLAPTPPMGWNSWDAYGTTVKEDEVKANADVMASALKQYGWQYIVIDIQWYEPNAQAHGYRPNAELAMDSNGRLIPAENRFPSSANGAGFVSIANYVHSKGLKFGIHILRGIPRQAVVRNSPILGSSAHAADIADKQSLCAWNTDMYGVDMSKPGAQAYYDSIVALYAGWGVDFIKADDMSRPYHKAEIAALHQAILHSGRPIVLSLSPGPAPLSELEHLRENAQMWRIEDDLWDNWKSVKAMYLRAELWAPSVTRGHWPDADMLPLGHIGIRAERGNDRLSQLSHDEQITLMTLWSIFRSPLMFGGDLPSLDPFTRSLITNAEVLAVNQHSSGNRLAYRQGDLRVWTAKAGEGSSQYAAVFNLSDTPAAVHLTWAQAGIAVAPASARELWTGQKSAKPAGIDLTLAPHASALYLLTTP